jgi:hypothetical protein
VTLDPTTAFPPAETWLGGPELIVKGAADLLIVMVPAADTVGAAKAPLPLL